MKRYSKGEYGYFSYQKTITIIKTIVLYITAILIFYIGYKGTGKKENLFTVVAILDLLPASRSLVSMIMFIKVPKFDELIYNKIIDLKLNSDLQILYNLYLTSYKNNYALECIAVKGNTAIGLAVNNKCDINLCQTHILDFAKQNGIGNLTVKIFNEKEKFIERISSLQNIESGKKDEDIINLLKDLSL